MNRSEELCRLLGIEPVYKFIVVTPTEKWRDKQICRKTCEKTSCYGCSQDWRMVRKSTIDKMLEAGWEIIEDGKELIYPDLTKPSNFVKLLKIHPKGTSSFFHKCVEYVYGVKSLEDDIIGTIIDKVFPSLTTRHKNLAKQQAQATKWDY